MRIESRLYLQLPSCIVWLFLGIVLTSDPSVGDGTRWAVLVAGSSGWFNYRHQADLCHAYQILHTNGIPDENIIVMMYDDIANNVMNTLPGTIINKPNGTDVYYGVPKDYTGSDVTPENFIHVLTGNSEAMNGIGSGKVVRSGPNDRIFINLVDHGGVGIFAFPTQYLKARELIGAIQYMNEQQMYKEMVIYLESCESGSMFEALLPNDIGVFAMTASSPTEPSYACYFDERLRTYLGDYFSVMWMEDLESENPEVETFLKQYKIVSNETRSKETTSLYGDSKIESETVSNFVGENNEVLKENEKVQQFYHKLKRKSASAVPDLPFDILYKSLEGETSSERKSFYQNEIHEIWKNRNFMENKVREILLNLFWDQRLSEKIFKEDSALEILDWDCYESAVHEFHTRCFNLGLNPYALRFLKVFVGVCNHGYTPRKIHVAMQNVCNHPRVFGIL